MKAKETSEQNDEMKDLKSFLEKKKTENKVLKKIIEKLKTDEDSNTNKK